MTVGMCGSLDNYCTNFRRLIPMALFTKPLSEIRKDFVLNRFAEDNLFRRRDIADWLKQERQSPHPDHEMWSKYLGSTLLCDVVEEHDMRKLLLDCADPMWFPFDPKVESNSMMEWLEKLEPLLAIMHRLRDVKLYVGTACCLIIVSGKEDDRMFLTFNQRNDGISEGFWPHGLLYCLYGSWYRSGNKWQQSRDIMCQLMDQKIAATRSKAEKDFNQAVAVSDDGTKILSTNWVIVFHPDNGYAKVYPARAFRGQPCWREGTSSDKFRPNHMRHISLHIQDPALYFDETSIAEHFANWKCGDGFPALSWLRSEKPTNATVWQVNESRPFEQKGQGHRGQLLIIPASNCCSGGGMPEGGIELKLPKRM